MESSEFVNEKGDWISHGVTTKPNGIHFKPSVAERAWTDYLILSMLFTNFSSATIPLRAMKVNMRDMRGRLMPISALNCPKGNMLCPITNAPYTYQRTHSQQFKRQSFD